MNKVMRKLYLTIINCIVFNLSLFAQHAVNFSNESLAARLEKIGRLYNVYFSYDANQIENKTVAALLAYDIGLDQVIQKSLEKTGMTYKTDDGKLFIIIHDFFGSVKGRVIDESSGEPIKWASVRIGQTELVADSNGAFNARIDAGKHFINITSIGYTGKTLTGFVVMAGKLQYLDIVLKRQDLKMNAIKVLTSVNEEYSRVNYVKRKSAANITDGIYYRDIEYSPEENNLRLLKRLNGVSVAQDRYVTIRGLTERYSQVLIDNIPINGINFNRREAYADIIPKEAIASMFVAKSSTPDQNQEFGGGQINFNLLDIPAQSFTSIALGIGFNNQRLQSDYSRLGAKTGLLQLGFSEGVKQFPNQIKSWYRYPNLPPPPGTGNGTSNLTLTPNSKELYSGLDAIGQSKLFSSEGLERRAQSFIPNLNFRFSLGRAYSFNHFGKLGWTAAIFSRSDQKSIRYNNPYLSNTTGSIYDTLKRRTGTGFSHQSYSNAGVLFNIGLVSQRVSLSLQNLYSANLRDVYYEIDKYRTNYNATPRFLYKELFQQPRFTSFNYHKLNLKHQLGNTTQLDYYLTYYKVGDNILDQRRLRYNVVNAAIDNANAVFSPNILFIHHPDLITPAADSRLWLVSKEHSFYFGASFNKKISLLNTGIYIKAGYDGIINDGRLSYLRAVPATSDMASQFKNMQYQTALSGSNMGIGSNQAYYWIDNTSGNVYRGSRRTHSFYAMADQKLFNKTRIVYGARIEHFTSVNKQAHYVKEKTLYHPNDNPPYQTEENIAKILPSVNIIHPINNKINVKVAYYRTFVHPDYRESSFFSLYDFDLNANISGRQLQSTSIENADLRFEWMPTSREVVSINGYYKYLSDPIELARHRFSDFYGYMNQKYAINVGVELEVRKSLSFVNDHSFFRNLFLGGNVSFTRSRVRALGFPEPYYTGKGTQMLVNETRPLYGQTPWIFNMNISYSNQQWGCLINYNKTGPRTFTADNQLYYPEFENGIGLMDLECFKKIFRKRADLNFTFSNILNQWKIFYVKKNSDNSNLNFFRNSFRYERGDIITDRMKTGSSFSVSLNLKL